MNRLVALFFGKPPKILTVAAAFLAVHLWLRTASAGAGRPHRLALLAAAAWGLYAAWEWLVRSQSPDANIRVDLLVIWPAPAILSAWAIARVFR
jgi:hypothetical protein